MSGRKTTYIRVPEGELARLRREAARASSLSACNDALQRLAARSDEQLRQSRERAEQLGRDIRSLSRTLESRTAAASRERAQLRAQLQSAVEETGRALEESAARNRQALEAQDRNFRSALTEQRAETLRALRESEQRMDSALRAAAGDLQRQIGAVNGRLDRAERQAAENARRVGILFDSDAALLELAREYADTARTAAEDTAQRFRLELLLPGRLAQVRERVEQAERDIGDASDRFPTNAPVARLSARQAAEAALQLREDAVQAEAAWQAALQQANAALSAAQAQIEACRRVRFPESTAEVDVDRWSDGDLTRLNARLAGLRKRVQAPQSLSLSDLGGLRQAGEQLTREAQESAEFAVLAFGASQDRADAAQDVADSLRDALGLAIVSRGYRGGDDRGAHRIHLRNARTGFEMVVTQYPERDENGALRNRLESDILDYGTNNEEEGDRVAAQALRQLSGLGFAAPEVQTVPGFERRVSDRREVAEEDWERAVETDRPRPVHETAARPEAAAR